MFGWLCLPALQAFIFALLPGIPHPHSAKLAKSCTSSLSPWQNYGMCASSVVKTLLWGFLVHLPLLVANTLCLDCIPKLEETKYRLSGFIA